MSVLGERSAFAAGWRMVKGVTGVIAVIPRIPEADKRSGLIGRFQEASSSLVLINSQP
jgi:hypothetical protein